MTAKDFRYGSGLDRPEEGHYLYGQIDSQSVILLNDSLGIRTLYWIQLQNQLLLSTRLDWLTPFLPECKLNPGAFGSHWLIKNIVTNFARLHRAGGTTEVHKILVLY